tara:strand:- start:12640 stop:13929 length:1290 start_codon:yes stop_codon:yes gene_type:complete
MKTIRLFLFIVTLGALLTINIQAQITVLNAKGYVDVKNGELISPAVIVIEAGIITDINPSRIPKDAEEIDLINKYLMPGMMDMHVHLDFDFSSGFDVVVKESASKGAIQSVYNAEKTLMAGFTTVRTIGQVHYTLELIDVALAEASEEGIINAPRIIPAGHMITILGGHGDLAMGEGLKEGMIEAGPEYGVVSGVDDAIKATRFQIKHGAKTIKIHATAGVLSLEDAVGAQQLSDEEMVAIIEEAHRHEIPVAAHAHGTEGIKAAIRAGINSIEHGSILDDEAIQMMIDNEVVLVPTSGLMEVMDKEMLPPKKKAKADYVDPLAKQSLSNAINAGVKIALGTDAPLIPHGDNAFELVAMINRGMSIAEALRSATTIPAALVNMEGEVGEIEEGMFADIIATDSNPLEDVKTLQNVVFVMKGGKIYKNVE